MANKGLDKEVYIKNLEAYVTQLSEHSKILRTLFFNVFQRKHCLTPYFQKSGTSLYSNNVY